MVTDHLIEGTKPESEVESTCLYLFLYSTNFQSYGALSTDVEYVM